MWTDVVKEYGGRKRHYHNLDHLGNMLTHLESCRALINDWDCVLFALFYHDYVYQPTAKDNEEQSAEAAKTQLTSLKLSVEKIGIVAGMILATKSHNVSENSDVNYFTDADLSILGASRNEYDQYTKDVRNEYSIYPDILYKPGRKKVLKHFLDMPAIFKTTFFRDRLEKTARENIAAELRALS
jgi:predicted metal-dependent HD superfamily phosphohydrolase